MYTLAVIDFEARSSIAMAAFLSPVYSVADLGVPTGVTYAKFWAQRPKTRAPRLSGDL